MVVYDFSTTPAKDHHLLEVFSDSDWAGRKDTRRSTSSGTIFLDGQCIYSFSRNQKSVSLSSGEAEYYAGASAASDCILLQEAVKFLTQRNCKVHLHMDSSAARGIITRQGVGRVKHLQIRTLFLQDLHKQGTISVHPVGTKENTADIGTNPLSAKRIRLLLHWLGFQTSESEPVGKEELKEHKAQAQAKAAVRMIKSQGSLSFAALLFAGISVVTEGFQQESFQNSKESSFSMSACVQGVMSADTSACALGTCVGTVADTSACAVGTCTGTVADTSACALGSEGTCKQPLVEARNSPRRPRNNVGSRKLVEDRQGTKRRDDKSARSFRKEHRADVAFAQFAFKPECYDQGNVFRDEKLETVCSGTSRRHRETKEHGRDLSQRVCRRGGQPQREVCRSCGRPL